MKLHLSSEITPALAWPLLVVLLVVVLTIAPPSRAESGWSPSLDLRYRLEVVDDDRFARDATASTLRLRAGIVSPEWSGFSLGLTGHANRALLRERFNSTANGKIEFPVVADSDDEAISEAWLRYRSGEHFQLKAGRQRINEDNQRFIGSVGFRQLEQTFDAVTAAWTAGATQVNVSWLDSAHRIFGRSNPNPLLAEFDLNAWTGSLSHEFSSVKVAAYAQRLVFQDRPASHRNLGVRFTGNLSGPALDWRLELTRQDGLRELSDVSVQNYFHLRLAQRHETWHWFAGHERLGGDGESSFQTPLATGHAFNGWTDQFLVTPVFGLADSYAAAGTRVGQWSGLLKIHDFRTDKGNRRLGHEYGLVFSRPLPAGWSFETKAAWFDGHGGSANVGKLWLAMAGSW